MVVEVRPPTVKHQEQDKHEILTTIPKAPRRKIMGDFRGRLLILVVLPLVGATDCQSGPWNPDPCPSCTGVQKRVLECRNGQFREEERTCFDFSLCTPTINPLALTASFVPYLHVGPWSPCQTLLPADTTPRTPRGSGLKKKKKRKKRKKQQQQQRLRRDFHPTTPPPWSPILPNDLEISFVAEAEPPPLHGTQTRQVECRGQDGEALPFR